MLALLWLVPAVPLAGFVILALAGSKLPRKIIAAIGAGTVGLAAVISVLIAASFIALGAEPYRLSLWNWMDVGRFSVAAAFYLDALSAVMLCVVTVVGFFIHLYSADFMREDEGYSRFFAYMNLFVCAMVILILADNLVLLLVGWEGVGLCSYLLIGFWYSDPDNGRAARKAFVVTRVGDTALLLGLFLLFYHLGTLEIQPLLQRASAVLPPGGTIALAAGLLLLGGAVGKSAQIPLQVWLPDAMAGPSPVSALIHAATMVTAGVYLIARTHVIFLLAPDALFLVGVVGAVTLLVAACSAVVTVDFKRVLAYSTISQIGYMFLALGVGAWTAAVFHLVTHAFFKSLLFLSAGAVIHHLHEEHDIFHMGGLRKSMPVTFWTFLAGSASLAALPLVTAGFYSKDMILKEAALAPGGQALFLCGLAGSLLTGLYAFRLVFVVFFGKDRGTAHEKLGINTKLPLIVLAIGALITGFLGFRGSLGPGRSLLTLLESALPAAAAVHHAKHAGMWTEALLVVFPVAGVALAYWFYLARPRLPAAALQTSPAVGAVQRLWLSGWEFDWLYGLLFVRPFVALARVNKRDFIDLLYRQVEALHVFLYHALRATQSGLVRQYAGAVLVGAIVCIAMMVLL